MEKVKVSSIRLPADLHERLSQEAKREDRTLNGLIVHLLKQARPAASPQIVDMLMNARGRG